ncbi:complement factor b, like [Colossoma macropomum]|uniref:complement factor b, like n=1 Tax=Colossoma macropomum TaxID=42526 RepID=UPI001863E71C|nr:complement factor b, like [Colossoma macropomum]
MESVLCYLLFFVMTGICPLVTGAPSELKCPDSNLNITGGTFTLSKNYDEGSTLKFHCPQGYYPYPVKKRQCSRGKWDPAPTKRRADCRKITCPNPHGLDNGVVEPYKPLYYVNDTTTYRCHSDYTFRGSSTRVCQLNGKWSGSTPICSRDSDHCPDPGTPPGASRTGHIFNIDDKVTYRCDNKLKLLGSKVRVCQDGGQWSGREPECYADYTYDTPAEVAEAFGSTLKTTLTTHEENGQQGKKIILDQKGKLNIYIALDASDSIEEEEFERAKEIIIKLIDKISYYEVSPNYEIIIFATEATRIVSIADYKREDERKLYKIINTLKDYKYDDKGQKSGTNIAKAYKTILDSMSFEKTSNITAFIETRHVIIMFTDGIYNMGGNPIHHVNEIKQLVYHGDDMKRDEYLDIYAFGVGEDVQKEDIDFWVTNRPNEKHFFLLPNMEDVQQTFDEMIDESTSVGLCGLYRSYRNYDEQSHEAKRQSYPWLIQFFVTREDGTSSNCLGSLVTPSFILTAAHCFKFEDLPDNIKLETPTSNSLQPLKAKDFMLHPKYKPRGKVSEGISEYYEHDVALIELEQEIKADASLRPICIPCTKETSGALRLSGSDVTCAKHKEELLTGDLVNAFFMSAKQKQGMLPKNDVQIKLGHKRDACIEDAKKALNISDEKARLLITDNFLCTGGEEQNHVDEVSCKGDSGGATFVQQKVRAFQVGVVSWGLKDLCTGEVKYDELSTARDFHIDLFNPEVQNFLQMYLGDEQRGTPLTFLKR